MCFNGSTATIASALPNARQAREEQVLARLLTVLVECDTISGDFDYNGNSCIHK
jgi:hypothetical protein